MSPAGTKAIGETRDYCCSEQPIRTGQTKKLIADHSLGKPNAWYANMWQKT